MTDKMSTPPIVHIVRCNDGHDGRGVRRVMVVLEGNMIY